MALKKALTLLLHACLSITKPHNTIMPLAGVRQCILYSTKFNQVVDITSTPRFHTNSFIKAASDNASYHLSQRQHHRPKTLLHDSLMLAEDWVKMISALKNVYTLLFSIASEVGLM